MAKAIDIELNGLGGDLIIKNGDLSFWESDKSHIYDIIISNKGDWKNNINLGIGIQKYENSSGQQNIIAQEIKIQLTNDGYTVTKPVVNYINQTGELDISPNADRE